MTDSDKPDITERFEIAASTSNLALDCREGAPIGAAGMMVAAGWSPVRVGMALLRLASEWDSAAKPRKPSLELIEALCVTIRTEDAQAKEHRGSVAVRAQARAQAWYVSELRLLAVSLKSRAVVWDRLEHWRALRGIDPDTVAAALLHWLAPRCPHCAGHGFMRVPDQPALGAKRCHHCYGAGEMPRPSGSAVVLNFLDSCAGKARESLSSRLRDRR